MHSSIFPRKDKCVSPIYKLQQDEQRIKLTICFTTRSSPLSSIYLNQVLHILLTPVCKTKVLITHCQHLELSKNPGQFPYCVIFHPGQLPSCHFTIGQGGYCAFHQVRGLNFFKLQRQFEISKNKTYLVEKLVFSRS